MIKLHVCKLCVQLTLLTHYQYVLKQVISIDPFRHLIDEEYQHYHNLLKHMCEYLKTLGLKSSTDYIDQVVYRLKDVTIMGLSESVSILRGIIMKELNEHVFLYVPKNDALWFNREDGFDQKISKAFPSSTEDIKEAGNCYACGNYTACVFHAMRVVEHGLRALAKDVGLTFDVQQWYDIINQIEKKIKEAQSLPKSPGKSARLKFLSEAAKEFVYFKDGWRNYVSHGHSPYNGPQALNTLNHVETFMNHLSMELSE